MIKLRIKVLEETAKSRPEGYLQTVLTAGRIEAGFLWLSEEAYAALRKQFSGESETPTMPIGKTRFEICKGCEEARNNAFDCALYEGCCFGAWRSNPAYKCPKGKW